VARPRLRLDEALFERFAMSPVGQYTAELLTGESRASAWATAVDFYAGYEAYRITCAPRQMRVFRFRPAAG
jgi:hypothetical protein